jgi:hypothetical protein
LNVNTIGIKYNGFKKKPLLLVFVKTEIKPILFFKRDWKEMFNNYEMKKLYFELFTPFVLMILFKPISIFISGLNKRLQIKQKLNHIFKQLFSFKFRLVSIEEKNTSNTTTIHNSYNNINTIFFDNFQSSRHSYLNTLIINN